jgi:hypothetical protein
LAAKYSPVDTSANFELVVYKRAAVLVNPGSIASRANR